MPDFDGLSSHDLECTWGTTSFRVTSLQYSRSASAEVDVTGMDSTAIADPNWSDRRLVFKSTEYGVVDPGEVQLEFIANAGAMLLSNRIGHKDNLSFGNAGFSVAVNAILTQFSSQMQVGEFVRGNCTFKLTEI